jgi:hypothetical protein
MPPAFLTAERRAGSESRRKVGEGCQIKKWEGRAGRQGDNTQTSRESAPGFSCGKQRNTEVARWDPSHGKKGGGGGH